MENWAPREDFLCSVVAVLRDCLVPDSTIQRGVQEQMDLMKKSPDFTHYLLYILVNGQDFEDNIRSVCAVILKNNILCTYEKLPQDTINEIRIQCLRLIHDSSKDVCRSVTTLIGLLVSKTNLLEWPEVVPYLCQMLDSSDNKVCQTSLTALFKICQETLVKKDEEKEESRKVVIMLVSKFITLVTSNQHSMRKNSIRLLNQMMLDHGVAIGKYLDSKAYLNNLFQVFNDEDAEIQKHVCETFVRFMEMQDEVICPYISNIIEYMLQKSQHSNKEVALQASEFWLECAKLPNCTEMLRPYIHRLTPILLENMKYSEYELAILRSCSGIDEHLEDDLDDIRPFSLNIPGEEFVDDEDLSDIEYYTGDGESYEPPDAIGEPNVGWTLRKCNAAALDALSLQFRSEILPSLMPLLNEALSHQNYLIKESAILALGAISEGCMNSLREYLPDLVGYLLVCMNSEYSLIRVITSWSLSRYMVWIMESKTSVEAYFVPVMTILLKHVLDQNKRVQRSALSAFCVFQEEARLKLIPYMDFILQAFLEGLRKCKFRSCLLLFEAIGVLATSVGNHLNKPDYVQMLVPPLMRKFTETDNYYDEGFKALTDCLANIATAVEIGFLPYSEVAYSRCLLIINEILAHMHCYVETPEGNYPPDKDPMYVVYHLLIAMAGGLKTYFVKYVCNSNLVQQMYYTLQDDLFYIRQPSLNLYGELITLCFPHLSVTIHEYIPIIIENLDKRYDGVCNNAAWVIGKLCIAMGNNMMPYVSKIFESYMAILESSNGTRAMHQTVAVSLCILGLVCPDRIAPELASMIRPCCQALSNIKDCNEKDMGFRGLCELIVRNPAAAVNDFMYFCEAVASWNNLRPDLKEIIKDILNAFRNQCGETNWIRLCDQFPPLLKVRLNVLYNV